MKDGVEPYSKDSAACQASPWPGGQPFSGRDRSIARQGSAITICTGYAILAPNRYSYRPLLKAIERY